jgi:hypothetical protein
MWDIAAKRIAAGDPSFFDGEFLEGDGPQDAREKFEHIVKRYEE